MAEAVHSEGVPVSWNLNFATAREEKAQLDDYHQRFGDEVIMIRGSESLEEWRKLLPWARLNMVHGARPEAVGLAKFEQEGIAGIWGYCDQQVGIDGITHWGCPWGIFPVSKNEVARNQPYPREPVSPTLIDWQPLRQGESRTYRYRIQSFYSMPYGIAEWGRFDGWKVAETNTLQAKIVDNQVLLVRMNLDLEDLAHNQRWQEFQVTLVPDQSAPAK